MYRSCQARCFLNSIIGTANFSAVPIINFIGGDLMYFDFVFDIFTGLSSLSILIPLVAVVALYGVIRLCLSLYRGVEK